MKTYVLVTVEFGKMLNVPQELATVPGVIEVDAVAGIYDLVAVLETETPKQAGEVIVNTIQKADGVLSTVTLMKFD